MKWTRFTVGSLPGVALLIVATTAWAQSGQPGSQGTPSATQPGNQPSAAQSGQSGQGRAGQDKPDRRFSVEPDISRSMPGGRAADSQLAACLIIDNEGEVAAGQFAQQRSQNEDVKRFAQTMIEQHTQLIGKLQQFAGGMGSGHNPGTRSTTPTRPGAASQPAAGGQLGADPGVPQTGVAAAQTQSREAHDVGNPADGRRGQGGLDFIAIKRELAAACKQTMERELGQKQGAEFDKCYMGQQVMAHLHAIDAMRVARNHSSPELQHVLDEGIRTAETHLQHAKELAKRTEQTASQPAASQQR